MPMMTAYSMCVTTGGNGATAAEAVLHFLTGQCSDRGYDCSKLKFSCGLSLTPRMVLVIIYTFASRVGQEVLSLITLMTMVMQARDKRMPCPRILSSTSRKDSSRSVDKRGSVTVSELK
jgi:hypothetical protein